MNSVVNLLRSSAKVEIYGEYPEQFINNLAKHGMPFWKFRKLEKGKASVFIPLSYAGDAEKAKRGTDCDIKIIKERGLTHFLHSIRRRWMLIFGFFLCFIAVSVFSLFVWEIEVTGNEAVPTSEILAVLKNYGVHIGMFSLSIDQQDLRNHVLADLKDLSWMTVNIVGTKAEVIVRERIKKPEILDINKPANVVAAKSGMITKLNVYQGQPLINVGQTVSKGDILIGSEMQSLNSGTRQVHAMGEVYARTWYEFSYEMPLEYISKNYLRKESKKNTIILFGKRINLYFTTGLSDTFCDKIIKSDMVELPGGSKLPITVYSEKYKFYEPQTAVLEKAEAEKILKDRLSERLDLLIGDGKKVNVNFNTTEEKGIIKVTIQAECIEQIGLEEAK